VQISWSLILVFPIAMALSGQTTVSPPQDALVKRALAAEVANTENPQQLMRYKTRKSSPRLSTTKEIFETKDGFVARLLEVNDHSLGPEDQQKEQERLDLLLSDPARQRQRRQSQHDDIARALKILRVLPDAFIYQYAGKTIGPTGEVDKFTFEPNPRFNPPDLETEVLTAMKGELWIDASQERVARLEGHLEQDVDFGWGILGRLNKGGWILLEQAEVCDHQWRIVHFKMNMSGRVIFSTKVFDTVEDQSQFEPVDSALTYRQAIRILRSDQEKTADNSP
jgi:hypothetical protein